MPKGHTIQRGYRKYQYEYWCVLLINSATVHTCSSAKDPERAYDFQMAPGSPRHLVRRGLCLVLCALRSLNYRI